MKNDPKDIVNSFKKSLVSDELEKISENVSETIIDSVLNEGIFKEIPLVGTTLGLFKVGKTISARHQVRKLWKFLFQLNQVTQSERLNFLKKTEENRQERDELFERTLFIIERLDEERKSSIIGRLFSNLILGKINTADYLRLSVIVDKTSITDLIFLELSYRPPNINSNSDNELRKFYRENDTDFIRECLVIAGLLKKEINKDKARLLAMGLDKTSHITEFKLTVIGRTLIKFGF